MRQIDPDATLDVLRTLLDALRPALRGESSPIGGVSLGERLHSALDAAGDLADRLGALDASLSAGGPLPRAWERAAPAGPGGTTGATAQSGK